MLARSRAASAFRKLRKRSIGPSAKKGEDSSPPTRGEESSPLSLPGGPNLSTVRNDPTTTAHRSDLTTVAAEKLGNLRNELISRHAMPAGRISTRAGTGTLRLPDFSVWYDNGRFTWINGYDRYKRPQLGKAPVAPLHAAADLIAARYREIHGIQPAPARRAG